MLQARRKEHGLQNSQLDDWIHHLVKAGEIYTLGYIYYIPFDPEAGAGFVVDNQKKTGKQTRQHSWVLILQLL